MSENLTGLGRLRIEDERDLNYPVSTVLTPRRGVDFQYWNSHKWWGDQGSTPFCVPYSWAHWLEDGPVFAGKARWRSTGGHVRGQFQGEQPGFDLDTGYNWMQQNDYWPGTDYDGTSVRAGAKYLVKKGFIKEYRWAWDANTVVTAIMELGPVILGTMWYMDMFTPDSRYGRIEPSGSPAGGHAYIVNGVNVRTGWFRIKNSWGQAWGRNGHAYIKIEDLDYLIKDRGEACIAIS